MTGVDSGRGTIAVVNRKGGSGKSTTTLNLAGALLELGLRVLVVDLDPQASLTRLLSAEPVVQSIGACIRAPGTQVLGCIRPTGAGMDLLPGDRAIEAAAFELYDSPVGFLRLRRVLAPIACYDVLLLDTPPTLGFALTSAVLAAGWAIMPTATTQQDIDALVDTLAVLEELRTEGLPCARVLAIVPNSVRHDGPDQAGLEVLRRTYGSLVSAAVPHAAAIKRALNNHLPLSQTEPGAPALLPYRTLARRVVEALATQGGRLAHADA